MDPADPAAPLQFPLGPAFLAQDLVALQDALTLPGVPEAWREVRQRIPWLLAEKSRIRTAGWFN